MAALQSEFADEDVAVVAICLGCSTDEARAGLRNAGAEGIVTLLDQRAETMGSYHASATPTTYLIDQDGVIQVGDVGYGGGTEAHLRSEIERSMVLLGASRVAELDRSRLRPPGISNLDAAFQLARNQQRTPTDGSARQVA